MALDLTSTPKAPPPPKRASAAQKQVAAKLSEREEAVNGLFQLGAAGCMLAGQTADAGAIATHGPNIARETAAIAENNEGFAKVLDYLTAVGPYAGLLTATMPLILQVMVNHKRLPAAPLAQFGVMDPDALAAQIKADAMREQARLMAEAQKAQREIEQIEAEAKANGRKPESVPA